MKKTGYNDESVASVHIKHWTIIKTWCNFRTCICSTYKRTSHIFRQCITTVYRIYCLNSHMETWTTVHGECPFGGRLWCERGVWGVCIFLVVSSRRCVWLSTCLSSPSHWGHLVGIASAAVTLCFNADRLLIITVRDLSFFPVSDLQDNFGTL